jgi:hypothetical protein
MAVAEEELDVDGSVRRVGMDNLVARRRPYAAAWRARQAP